ncbi:MAG: Gfo/Idh/MocA family protein [Pseudomonadota bacterium]
MKVLLLGCSSIARRRVLPALAAMGHERVDIASVSTQATSLAGSPPFRLFRDYATALKRSDADVVYVSLINSLHAKWAAEALRSGYHVVVDKPACLSYGEVASLAELAARERRCLAEALVYPHHPQMAVALRLFEEAGTAPTRIVGTFSFPPLPPGDYRHRRDAGGGALWDLGPYAVSAGRIVFGVPPQDLIGRIAERRGDVDVAFAMLAGYTGGRDCIGLFGSSTGYVNRLEIMGPDLVVGIDRAFSPPKDIALELSVRRRDAQQRIHVPAADAFERFLGAYFDAVQNGRLDAFIAPMLADADALRTLRHSSMA